MSTQIRRPLWRYFGAKWKIAPKYPMPATGMIVEPFAGAAGYSLRYADRRVVLVEKNPVVAAVWRYLIGVRAEEIRRIPEVEAVDDLPGWVPQEARWFVGFRLCAGDTRPRARISPMIRRDGGCWDVDEIGVAVEAIKHWKIVEGEWWEAPNVEATWFIDAPYQVAGARAKIAKDRGRVRYPNGADEIDFGRLAGWCEARWGLVIVCEQEGATWLPFIPLAHVSSTRPGHRSREVIWTQPAGPSAWNEWLADRPLWKGRVRRQALG